VQLYAPDDGRGDARNMLSHTWTSGNKLVKLLHLVGWIIRIIIWRCLLRTYQLIHIFYVRKETAVMLKILSVSLQFIRPGDQPQKFCAPHLSTKTCLHLWLPNMAGLRNVDCFLWGTLWGQRNSFIYSLWKEICGWTSNIEHDGWKTSSVDSCTTYPL